MRGAAEADNVSHGDRAFGRGMLVHEGDAARDGGAGQGGNVHAAQSYDAAAGPSQPGQQAE